MSQSSRDDPAKGRCRARISPTTPSSADERVAAGSSPHAASRALPYMTLYWFPNGANFSGAMWS